MCIVLLLVLHCDSLLLVLAGYIFVLHLKSERWDRLYCNVRLEREGGGDTGTTVLKEEEHERLSNGIGGSNTDLYLKNYFIVLVCTI